MISPQYYFLFIFAGIWIVIASIRDLKIREVPNWINFSLIGFALAYRAFYSSFTGDWNFFAFGIYGFILFFGLANLFYYSKVFAGGDAKMLMGLGIILPFESFGNLFLWTGVFILLLFTIGSIYSLFYSIIIVSKNKEIFRREFYKNIKKYSIVVCILVILMIIFSFIFYEGIFAWIISFLFAFLGFVYIYVKSIDVCMIKLVRPEELTEGDWLERSVRVGGKMIRKSVHGLSIGEIEVLRKAKKKVYIKEGIPFIPAFLITFVVMVFFYSTGLFSTLSELAQALFS